MYIGKKEEVGGKEMRFIMRYVLCVYLDVGVIWFY